MSDQINSGEIEYNALKMNCSDAVERAIEKAIGVKLPDDPRPNENFKKVKNNQKQIQDSIDLRAGIKKVYYIPSGLDNYPTRTRPVLIPDDENGG